LAGWGAELKKTKNKKTIHKMD